MSLEQNINKNTQEAPSVVEEVEKTTSVEAPNAEEEQAEAKKQKEKEDERQIQELKIKILEHFDGENKEYSNFNLKSNPELENKVYEAFRFKENSNTLYHFTFNGEGITKNGFESSKRIDEGIGADGASLIGTYFFENEEDIGLYIKRAGAHFLDSHKDKESSVIKAVLPPDAKILDSYTDGGKEWDRVVKGFIVSFVGKPIKQYDEDWTDADTKKLSEINSKRGTPEYSRNLTKYLLEQGYDAVRLPSALGEHTELIVINEKLLSIVKNEDENLITSQQKKEAEELYSKYRETSTLEMGSDEDIKRFKEFVSKSKLEQVVV